VIFAKFLSVGVRSERWRSRKRSAAFSNFGDSLSAYERTNFDASASAASLWACPLTQVRPSSDKHSAP
jgi:hypothetical protein